MADITSPIADMQDKPKVVFESTKEAVRLAQASLNRDMPTHGGPVCMVPAWVLRVLVGCGQRQQEPAPASCVGCGCEHDEIHNPTDTCATCNGGSRYHPPKPAPAPLPYGTCPICNAIGVNAERSPFGMTTCTNGHKYPHHERVFPPDPTPAPMPRTPEDSNTNGSDGVPGGNPRTPAPLPVDIEELLGIAQELPLGPNDAQDLRAFISDLTRRLAEAEAEKEQVVRWHDDLAKKCRDLLDDAVKYTQHRHQLEDRAEAAEARVAELETHLSGVGVRQYREAVERLHKAEAFKSRVMAWASERCICGLVGKACPKGMFDGETKWATPGPCPNWTPPQAWEAGE